MSDSLSVTTMISVDTRLKAATATMRVRITNITVLSIFSARKKFAWCLVQSRNQYRPPNERASSRLTWGASNMSASFTRRPLTPRPSRNRRWASAMWITASPVSYCE